VRNRDATAYITTRFKFIEDGDAEILGGQEQFG